MGTGSPTTSIIFFIALTLVYSMFKYKINKPQLVKLVTILYFVLLIVGQIFFNLALSKDICGSSQASVAILATLGPWMLIFGTIYVLLIVFPTWLEPFSNTFGYFFTYITGVNGFLKSILIDKNLAKLQQNESAVVTALNNVYADKSLLINSMTESNLPLWWENMKAGGILKPNTGDINGDAYNELLGYVKMKAGVSEFIWYLLTGVLVSSVSYNYILNTGCTQTAEEMEKRHNEYLAQESKISDAQKENGSKQIVYKTYE